MFLSTRKSRSRLVCLASISSVRRKFWLSHITILCTNHSSAPPGLDQSELTCTLSLAWSVTQPVGGAGGGSAVTSEYIENLGSCRVSSNTWKWVEDL